MNMTVTECPMNMCGQENNKTIQRTCTYPEPQHGGANCNCTELYEYFPWTTCNETSGVAEIVEACPIYPCPTTTMTPNSTAPTEMSPGMNDTTMTGMTTQKDYNPTDGQTRMTQGENKDSTANQGNGKFSQNFFF